MVTARTRTLLIRWRSQKVTLPKEKFIVKWPKIAQSGGRRRKRGLENSQTGWSLSSLTMRTSSSCKITSTLELTPPQYPVPLGPFPSSVEEECKLLPLCRAKPSPSFIHLPASNPATCQNNQSAKLQTGVYMKKPQDCLGLLECMHANLQLQTKLAQQQMAILEDLQSSMTLLIPGGEGKDSLLPAIRPNLLLTCQPQISK
ncbi:TSSK6-activating co-chaperone protein isoform X6 [Macrotis lagotis]|uniref:TSSK6-activating co-chaperone protein isoform X6 n=1 Tax=Macrotis lagotis TaxID=92651 RepID=UPI003D689C6D